MRYVNELVVMCSRHHTTVADPALADPAELRRRSQRLIGGTASCDQLHFRRSWFRSKQTSIRPSLCSYKLIHIIYIVWTLIFTFTWMCFFYGSSWSHMTCFARARRSACLLGDGIEPRLDAHSICRYQRSMVTWFWAFAPASCFNVLTLWEHSTCSLIAHWENSLMYTIVLRLARNYMLVLLAC